jgi:hypothetical protein
MPTVVMDPAPVELEALLDEVLIVDPQKRTVDRLGPELQAPEGSVSA